MKIVLAYVPPMSAKVVIALNKTGREFERVNVSKSDEHYWRLFDKLWKAGEEFVNIEQDIVVSPTILDELENCPAEWCSVAYPYLNGQYPGLGCVRFRAALLQRRPNAVIEAGEWSNAAHKPKHWCAVDHSLTLALNRAGETKHVHYEGVDHLGDHWPTHGCVPRSLKQD
jgi:hypothetical protein